MRSVIGPLAVVLAVVLVVGAPSALAAQEVGYKVIVNRTNPATALTRAELSHVFLKKAGAWPGGRPAVPVDLRGDAPARRGFSKSVHGREPQAIRAFWQQQIFSGRAVPPVEKASEADVIAFVRATPGAVGYVAAGTTTPEGVRVLELLP